MNERYREKKRPPPWPGENQNSLCLAGTGTGDPFLIKEYQSQNGTWGERWNIMSVVVSSFVCNYEELSYSL